MAKRKQLSRVDWSRAIAMIMASSKHLQTQTALSRKSGVAQSTIGRILRREVDPQAGNLERLANAFGMSLSRLADLEPGDAALDDVVLRLDDPSFTEDIIGARIIGVVIGKPGEK